MIFMQISEFHIQQPMCSLIPDVGGLSNLLSVHIP